MRRTLPAQLARGNFVRPTVFADVRNDMKIAQDEIFGPVACLIPFDDEADAIRIANDIRYGLSSYVWTENLGRAHRVAAAIEAGMCFVNSQNVRDLRQPFGGTKASGTGREGGTWSFEVFLEPKNVCISLGHRIPGAARWGARVAMGTLALAAKITHVPSMYLSELPGPHHGCRQARHRRPRRDRPPLPSAGRGHDRRVRRALARQRRLSHQLRAALQGHLHEQRAAALHQQHAVRISRQSRSSGA